MGPTKAKAAKVVQKPKSSNKSAKVAPARAIPKWTFEWSDEETTSLINWYQDHTYLWNFKQPDYIDKRKKKLSLESWLKERGNWPNINDDATDDEKSANLKEQTDRIKEVEKKFHGLRTRLNTELKKLPEWRSGAGADDILPDQSDWKYFSDMFFLKDVIAQSVKTKSSFTNDVEKDQPENANDDGYVNVLEQSAEYVSQLQTHNVIDLNTENIQELADSHVSSTPSQSAAPSKKLGKRTAIESEKHECMKKCLQILESSTETDDRLDHFFKYCAQTVRGYPPEVQNKMINDIQYIISSP